MFNIDKIKTDFPIFKFHPQLTYLDSAAMSLKPKVVIEAVENYYKKYSANVFRGIYKISEKATKEYENVRRKIAQFIRADSEKEIVFVRNTTEAINLVAYAWGWVNVEKGDEIVTTIMEHHSNFVPWQVLCNEVGAIFKVIDITDEGYLNLNPDKSKIHDPKSKTTMNNLNFLEKVVTKKTKILALTYVSNVLGTINPVKEIIKAAKKINPKIITVVDAAQAIPHYKINVKDLGCDFLAFSGQKMLGPTGAGVLWGRKELLTQMSPFLFGGEMISEVYLNRTIFAQIPHKFEAGTPHIAGVIGLGAAVDYLTQVGMDKLRDYEKDLTAYVLLKLAELKDITIYGPKEIDRRAGVVTFNLKDVHPHDVAAVLDEENICLRSGHHCAMPLHDRLRIGASVRVSFYLYNSKEDIDKLINGLLKVKKYLNNVNLSGDYS